MIRKGVTKLEVLAMILIISSVFTISFLAVSSDDREVDKVPPRLEIMNKLDLDWYTIYILKDNNTEKEYFFVGGSNQYAILQSLEKELK